MIAGLEKSLSEEREERKRLEELISDSASENFGIIERNGKQAYVNMDSMQIIGDFHDKCLPFKDGVGCVRDNGARNIVGPDGNKLLPMDVEKQVVMIYAVVNNYLKDIPVADIREFETDLLKEIEESHPDIYSSITQTKELTKENEQAIKEVLKGYTEKFLKSR